MEGLGARKGRTFCTGPPTPSSRNHSCCHKAGPGQNQVRLGGRVGGNSKASFGRVTHPGRAEAGVGRVPGSLSSPSSRLPGEEWGQGQPALWFCYLQENPTVLGLGINEP